ncbi:MAG: hypothetical protein D6725_09250 [Planctomycetota bacterium]|nr:MAG: hypothetical protein D6725_09250 [Planctomycetota bacterium]
MTDTIGAFGRPESQDGDQQFSKTRESGSSFFNLRGRCSEDKEKFFRSNRYNVTSFSGSCVGFGVVL